MSTKTKKKAVAAEPAQAKKVTTTKKPAVAKAVATVAPVAPTSSKFEIEDGAFFPPRTRASRGGRAYPFGTLAVGQSFFEKADEVDPAFYSSAEEAAKDQKANLDRVVNRVSGAKRRFMRSNPEAGLVFAIRTLTDPDKGQGVRVRREA